MKKVYNSPLEGWLSVKRGEPLDPDFGHRYMLAKNLQRAEPAQRAYEAGRQAAVLNISRRQPSPGTP